MTSRALFWKRRFVHEGLLDILALPRSPGNLLITASSYADVEEHHRTKPGPLFPELGLSPRHHPLWLEG